MTSDNPNEKSDFATSADVKSDVKSDKILQHLLISGMRAQAISPITDDWRTASCQSHNDSSFVLLLYCKVTKSKKSEVNIGKRLHYATLPDAGDGSKKQKRVF